MKILNKSYSQARVGASGQYTTNQISNGEAARKSSQLKISNHNCTQIYLEPMSTLRDVFYYMKSSRCHYRKEGGLEQAADMHNTLAMKNSGRGPAWYRRYIGHYLSTFSGYLLVAL
jgi:hypothetical protein